MQVSRTGYYAWKSRKPSQREIQNQILSEKIKTIFSESKETYGSPRIYQELKQSGVACSEKRIAQLMQAQKISAVERKRFVNTTDSAHDMPVAENLLDRAFETETPDTRWTADITYLWTGQGWLYLAVILDLFSRKIVGWSMSETIDRHLVVSALDAAISGRNPGEELLCHSDRGSQYASADYQKRLKESGIVCSMSRRGNCWDNAPTESFFAGLKKEMAHRTYFETKEQARSAVFFWIEAWYNRKRRHSALGYLSPEAFEEKYLKLQSVAVALPEKIETSRDASGGTYASSP